MENWRLRDMIWNFTPALKFAFIWPDSPEYLAIVLIFLISQFNPFQSQLVKKRNLKLYNAIDPLFENVSLQSFGHKGCNIFQPGLVFQPQTSSPDFSTMNFSTMNTLVLFYKQHMIKKTSWTFLDFIQ